MSTERKPVGIATDNGEYVAVVCDDGSMWYLDEAGTWREHNTIPGTKRAKQREREEK